MTEVSVDNVVSKNNISINGENESSIIDDDTVNKFMQDLSKFEVKEVLRNNLTQKQIAVVGKFENNDDTALIVLEKKIFPEEKELLEDSFFNSTITLNEIYRNDIYRGYDFFPSIENNGLNATLIYPATAKHIEKFSLLKFHLVEETKELYENVTLPQILSKSFSLKWVENILNGTAEADRVIFNDQNEETGFVLVKDSKWKDELCLLHLIALSRIPLKSIRDLNNTHLPLLKNIKDAGTRAIFDKYNLPADQLRVFLHYQPSYYHFHVHFIANTVENAGTNVERAHLLSSVINNIELMSDYYQKAMIPFCVCNAELFKPYADYMMKKNVISNTVDDDSSINLDQGDQCQ